MIEQYTGMLIFKNPIFIIIIISIAIGCGVAIKLDLWNEVMTDSYLSKYMDMESLSIFNEATNSSDAKVITNDHEENKSLGTPSTKTSTFPPTFDVVRIASNGSTVIAGKAEPGQTIEILDDEKIIGTVKADDRGEWVFVTTTPLLPGDHQLSLRSLSQTSTIIESDEVVVLVIPEPKDEKTNTFAVATSKQENSPSKLLQAPNNDIAVSLSIDVIDYDHTGEFSLSGRAAPETLINIYLDNTYIGTAQANMEGRWSLIPDTLAKEGQYTLRADQVNSKGEVQEPINMPFMRDQIDPGLKAGDFYVVQPGNSLWRIARRTYGAGLAYTLIYTANKEQIGNPDLIFPGQIFALPRDD